MLYLMVVIAIFNGIHASPKAKGSPALFLIIAPPSVGVVGWDLIAGDGTQLAFMSQALLGFCLGVLALLIRLGPKIVNAPPSLGSYWAYVFPMSALATATIRYAWVTETIATEIMAIVFVVLAILALLAVFLRMCLHAVQVIRGEAEWGDPLLSRERLASVKAINYAELLPEYETA